MVHCQHPKTTTKVPDRLGLIFRTVPETSLRGQEIHKRQLLPLWVEDRVAADPTLPEHIALDLQHAPNGMVVEKMASGEFSGKRY
jgi:hypothetical protein